MSPAASLEAPTNPARARGLRRARRRRARCEPVAWTPLPAAVDAVHLLALLTRVRAARVAAGELSAERLYDVRAFKSAYAELGYLRTLTCRRTGGTIVTSMPQLVRGLARMHPAWKIDGDWWADRDRHQRAVRRRLRDLDAMGLLRWRIGVDVDGEDARTELELRPAPDITDDELAAAAAALERWQARYGAALNTGSTTGIHNAAGHGRPLSATERQRRGVARARQRAQRLRAPSNTNPAPPCGTPATPENDLTTSARTNDNVCWSRTGARVRDDAANDPWLTRRQPPNSANDSAAINAEVETASLRTGGSVPAAASGSSSALAWDESALLERVATRLAARQPVWETIAVHARRRATEAEGWTSARGWPAGRLREAWVVWRYGSMCAAELGAAPAGRLEADDLQRLRRALVRYERHAVARPQGFPAGGLAVLAAVGAIAGERDARPRTLHYAIRVIDQLSRRMRAAATADDSQRRDRAAVRARRRRSASPSLFAFRVAPWPSWVVLDDDGDPILEDGELVTAEAGIAAAPGRDDPCYLQTLRDAELLAGLWPRADVDGRVVMANGASDYDLEEARRRARPGPYDPPPDRRAQSEPADLRLAQLADMALQDVQRLSREHRDELLAHHGARRAAQDAGERRALAVRLAAFGNRPRREDGDG
jgi:hypothetical protein